MQPEHWQDLVRSVVSGKKWLAAYDVAVAAGGIGKQLLHLGAGSVKGIAASRGTGPLPEGVDVEWLDVKGGSMMEAIRASERALSQLPADVLARLDAWDPERSARVIRPLFSGPEPIAGRAVYGARRAEWMALEDKTVVDAIWDELGAARAPSTVVPCTFDALREAAARLDRGQGTVWAGDNRSGWHGGASFTRWVRTPLEAEAAWELLSSACDNARVMPFLEGIPCSIHGIVLPGHVVALRPCEMLVLRRPNGEFQYAAAATMWDPPAADREAMRDLARRTGAWLRERVGFRGVFTIDGVMTADGFVPTELNPRFGAAIGIMTRSMPAMPLYLLHLAIVEGEDLDWRPAELEEALLGWADAHRDGRAGIVSTRAGEPARADVVMTPDIREVQQGEAPDVLLTLGPSPAGSIVFASFVPERTPVGPSLAPRVAAAIGWADARWRLGIGPLEPARDVRA
jgi:hypothetical protein